jgi:hypothetical protein
LGPSDVAGQLTLVNPEWQPIGPMIESPGAFTDPLAPPFSAPVTLHGTVALTKINIGGDFPGSHVGDDQNTFIDLDPADAERLATGNGGPPSCPNGEGCNLVEMEREFRKYPLFAWAGEGDGITAVGRWIFDCGHPDPDPRGGCSNNAGRPCILDSDCVTPGICNNPPFTSNLRAELHPPHALAIFREKSNGKTPATRADVYVSADTGGAGDACTVTHLPVAFNVLDKKDCFANHCSVTTDRPCAVDKDCASSEKCVVFDPTQGGPLTNVNASDFEFDMPLPPLPSGATSATLKIKTKDFKPKGGLMPKASFTPAANSPSSATTLHVVVPMTADVKPGVKPNVFAQRITAYWEEEKTKLNHVQVAFQNLVVHNPLKAAAPVITRQCTNPLSAGGGLSGTACTTNTDCTPGLCLSNGKSCFSDNDCSKTDHCSDSTACVGGITPGWELFGEVNGDWIQFIDKAGVSRSSLVSAIGQIAPFAAPPYTNATDQTILFKGVKFDEYLPNGASIHIASTGHGLGCNDANLYGHNLKESLARYGLGPGAACFGEGDPNPGRLEVFHTLGEVPPYVFAPANVLCTAAGAPAACCTGNKSGNCDANMLCTAVNTPFACCDDVMLGSCSDNTLCTASGAPFPCCTGSGTGECSTVTCIPPATPSQPALCTATSGKGDGGLCSGDATRLCLVDADCISPQTCNGACSDTGDSCHVNADCDPGAKCEFGHAFDLNYTIKVL